MLRVLILDDDATTLHLLSGQLSGYGMDIVACREIEAAEAILDHSRVHAVLTDLCVSPFGGLEGTRLIRHMATHFPETQVVAMSSHSEAEVRRTVIDAGASEFMEKPVDPLRVAMEILRCNPSEGAARRGGVCTVEFLDEFLAARPVFAHLQPIVNLQKASAPFELHGVEALARAPGDSILRNPEILFGYASRKDRLFETDLLCIQAGLREAVALGGSSRIFLNVQPRSLSNPGFTCRVVGMVEAAGLQADRIVFELTEQETILNPQAFARTLAEVRRLGFRIALDDFGVGFANLNLITDLLPEYVKISGYFARNLATDPVKRMALGAVQGMLGRMGIPAIMECVESEVEMEIVRDLKIEFAQGYHFSKPAPADDLIRSGRFTGLSVDEVARP